MPLADAAKIHVEAVVCGLMTAAGGISVPTINVFNFRRTTFVNVFSKGAFEAAFHTNIMAVIKAALNIRWTHTMTRVRCLNDADDPYQDTVYSGAGVITGDSLPSDQSAYLLLRTALRGRAARGNKHLGPMSESDTTTTSDIFNAGALTRLAAIGTALVAGFTTGAPVVTYVPCVISRKNSQLKTNPTTVVANDIIQVLVNKRVGSMKRRKITSVY